LLFLSLDLALFVPESFGSILRGGISEFFQLFIEGRVLWGLAVLEIQVLATLTAKFELRRTGETGTWKTVSA